MSGENGQKYIDDMMPILSRSTRLAIWSITRVSICLLLINGLGCGRQAAVERRAAKTVKKFTNEVSIVELQRWANEQLVRRNPDINVITNLGPLTNLTDLKLVGLSFVKDAAYSEDFVFITLEDGLVREGILVGKKGAKTGQGRMKIPLSDGVFYIFDVQ